MDYRLQLGFYDNLNCQRRGKIRFHLFLFTTLGIVRMSRFYRQLTAYFSSLGKLANQAIYYTFRNFLFFIFFCYEQSYLSIYWTDFHHVFTKWKVFA